MAIPSFTVYVDRKAQSSYKQRGGGEVGVLIAVFDKLKSNSLNVAPSGVELFSV